MQKLSKVHRKRLETLAALMMTVPKKRFDIGSWVEGEFCNVTKPSEAAHNECGSSACVGGWACTVPAFKRAGLKMGDSKEDGGWLSGVPVFDNKYSFDALAAFFGIADIEVYPSESICNIEHYYSEGEHVEAPEFLFGTDNSNDPKNAAKRIEFLIKFIDLYSA